MGQSERNLVETAAGDRLAVIADSFWRLTGRTLAQDSAALWNLTAAILAHGTEPSPLFFYANRCALELFRMSASKMLGMESRYSAEPGLRAERQAMFDRLERADIVSGYEGIRIAADGTRFRVEDAIIWNLFDESGRRYGQAAMLQNWQVIEG